MKAVQTGILWVEGGLVRGTREEGSVDTMWVWGYEAVLRVVDMGVGKRRSREDTGKDALSQFSIRD